MILHNLGQGFNNLLNGPSIAYLVGGSLAGMFIGVVPGLGGPVILSVVLAFVYHLSLEATMCLFLATGAGSFFSASITSILLNTPAHPEAFAVTFDGFPMAQRGEAGRALGISATATCMGGLVGCAVLVGFFQVVNQLPLLFHPPEYVALITIALLLVGTLGTDAASKALISAGIGIMISTIGADVVTGQLRFTFGAVGLYSGISLVSLALGLFALPQMILVFGTATTIARQNMLGQEVENTGPIVLSKGFGMQVIQGVLETFHHWGALIDAGLVGVLTGIVPGIGGFAANFMSYGIAQQMSRKRELFGTGIPEGIIAPEGSSLAKEAGGLVPLIGLGIPGGVGTALFLAALNIKGVRVGYGFSTEYPSLPYEMMWIVALGGLIGTTTGILAAPWLARVTRVPGPALVPFIMSFALIGPFVSQVEFFAVMEVIVFAVVGLTMRRLRYSLASFAIGLVLGPTLETNIFLTHRVYPGVSFLGKRPLADLLFVLAAVVLLLKTVQLRRDSRRANAAIDQADPELRAQEVNRRRREAHPYPLLAMITTAGIVAFAATYTFYALTHYAFATSLMPVIAGIIVLVGGLWRLPFEIAGYVFYRRDRAADGGAGSEAGAVDADVNMAVMQVVPVHVAASVGGASLMPISGWEEDSSPGHLVEGGVPAAPVAARTSSLHEVELKAWGRYGQYTREVVAFVWFLVAVGACYCFGFKIGVPAFCFTYGMTATRRVLPSRLTRLLYSTIGAVALGAIVYEIQNLLHIGFTPLV